MSGLLACGADGSTLVACEEVTARLCAAERSATESYDEVADELRRTAERISPVHLAELANDGRLSRPRCSPR